MAAEDSGFAAFVAGTAGRLLHVATLLTGEPAQPPGANPHAQRLLTAALGTTYAHWDRLRGEDPYAYARRELAVGFARAARRFRRGRGGPLSRLTPRERLAVVLRLYEGLYDEQVAALMGLTGERVRELCRRGVGTLRSAPGAPGEAGTPGGAAA
ncbi:sigma factor-like helix-turn-helix DNA-binding protein [Streptomyces sp. TRM76323]|uniref:Sigma factor-like helix-turn-helix DNA-binding protein n=1 Tax=Streptomyces tamarix TaxID=3078565 RepID=A0ABU3QDL3_9ACTN|nr:sigma factor-like helix-turn-helix DNA-binding protein [Streptomyces tamarix]MDT9680866.1 sigma factor-like helix-turn-helix DNA-binding protein [Streptomyces tamarix]